MLAIVPDELKGRRIDMTRLVHPRTGEPARFVVIGSQIWEVVRVGVPETRSAVVPGLQNPTEGSVVKDACVACFSPVHAVFLVLPTLWTNRARLMPLDLLRDLAAGDYAPLPDEAWQTAAGIVCTAAQDDDGVSQIQLDQNRLLQFLTNKVDTAANHLPASLQDLVDRAVAPLEFDAEPDHVLVKGARRHAGVGLVSSWLNPDVASWLDAALVTADPDLTAARQAAEKLGLARAKERASQALSEGAKRTASAPAGPAKRTKASTTPRAAKPPNGKYVSLTDIFKPKK